MTGSIAVSRTTRPWPGAASPGQLAKAAGVVLEVVQNPAEQHEVEGQVELQLEKLLLSKLDVECEHIPAEVGLLDERGAGPEVGVDSEHRSRAEPLRGE